MIQEKRVSFEINCTNIMASVGSKEEGLYFIFENKGLQHRFDFEASTGAEFAKMVTHLNRHWIRNDFIKRFEMKESVGKGGFASVDTTVTRFT